MQGIVARDSSFQNAQAFRKRYNRLGVHLPGTYLWEHHWLWENTHPLFMEFSFVT